MGKYFPGVSGAPVRPHRIVVGASGRRWACQVCREHSGVRPDEHGYLPVSCEPSAAALARYRENAEEAIADARERLAWADEIERAALPSAPASLTEGDAE